MEKKLKQSGVYKELLTKVLLTMKLIVFIICLSALSVLASGTYSQNARISLDLKNLSIKEVLREIENSSEYYFLYNNELVDVERKVDIQVEKETINNIIEELFKNQKVNYLITGRQIIISPKDPNTNSEIQTKISGRVTDTKGEPLPGVTVVVKGTSNGTITDSDGFYEISNVPSDVILVFSFVGMKSQEIAIKGKSVVNATMEEETFGVDEVVVVGYGSQKKVNLTGAVGMVKGDVLGNRPLTSVASGLQGLIPGLTISSSSGQPGNPKTTILVRGVNTINSDTEPLILIDGVIGASIDLLNPDDIESVSVLKDAASSAIYGARAANGVILITTKTGAKSEQVTINYSGYTGIQTPTTMPQMVNGREFMELSNEAMSNAGRAEVYSAEAFTKYDSGNYPNDYSNTDWLDAVYKKHSTQYNHNINVSGGNQKGGYYFSYGYLDQDGLIVGDPYNSNRHNFRINANTEISDRISLNGSLSYINFSRQDAAASGTAGVFRLAQRISPLLPVMWQTNESGQWADSGYYSYGSVSNPVNVAKNSGYNKLNSKTTSGVFNGTFKIIQNLELKGQYSFNQEGNDTKNYSAIIKKYKSDGTEDAGNATLKNSASESYYNYLSQTLNATLNYETKFGENSIKAIAGVSKEWGYNNWITASRDKIIYEGVEVVSGGTENIENGASGVEWAMLSYFGRINYDYKEKYLFEANIRYDGTSRFSSRNNNRWGTFPSFSAGWKFSEEEFMNFTKSFLNLGKFRASWGELGNQNVGSYYPYLTSLSMISKSYPFGGSQVMGVYQPTLSNSNIKWETLRMLNIGIDLQMLNNRLGMSFDWFKKNNLDAILKPIYPASLGTTSTTDLPFVNMGEIENKGWELNLRWTDRIKDLNYSANFNISDSKNKVIDLGESAPYLGSNEYRKEGDPLNAFYGFVTGGLFQPDDFEYRDENTGIYKNPKVPVRSNLVQPGDVKYLDISSANGSPDGVIDNYDKTIIGERYPRYTYSFKCDLQYKGFDFSFYLQGVGKVNGYLSDEARHCFINDYSVPQTLHLDRWTPNNMDASYPRLYYAQTHNLEVSDYWVEDASYLRLKNIQLGYTIPKEITNKYLINRLRIYFSSDNLFTISDYFKAYDPEIRSSSGDSYPQVKTFIFGVNVTFK